MIIYRKILELHDQGISLRGIAASTGNSCQKVTKAIELAKPRVILSLLHYEYETACRLNNKTPYSYRSFSRHYTQYAAKYIAILRIRRNYDEIMEVDWAGSTAFIFDRDSGEKVTAYVFVATLPCSQISYAEAALAMDLQSWISVHNGAYDYFGGVHKLLYLTILKRV